MGGFGKNRPSDLPHSIIKLKYAAIPIYANNILQTQTVLLAFFQRVWTYTLAVGVLTDLELLRDKHIHKI